MRILHVTDTYFPRLGGIELHVHDLASRQRAGGHDVEILTVTGDRGTTEIPSSLAVHRPASTRLTDKFVFGWRARDYARRHGFDVIHAHASTLSPLAYTCLGWSNEIPAVITVHSLWRRYTPLYQGFDAALKWSRWPVVWSAVSHAAAECVSNAATRPFDVPVVPNGIDLARWTNTVRTESPGHLRIVSVMRLAPRKRPMPLMRMLAAVRRALPADVKLSAVIVGEGPAHQEMQQFADRHGMSDWLSLPGHLPRSAIADVLGNADVYVAPATLESFGIAALEARAAGVPVIGRLGTGLSDFIIDAEDGVLVASDRAMVDTRLCGWRKRRNPAAYSPFRTGCSCSPGQVLSRRPCSSTVERGQAFPRLCRRQRHGSRRQTRLRSTRRDQRRRRRGDRRHHSAGPSPAVAAPWPMVDRSGRRRARV